MTAFSRGTGARLDAAYLPQPNRSILAPPAYHPLFPSSHQSAVTTAFAAAAADNNRPRRQPTVPFASAAEKSDNEDDNEEAVDDPTYVPPSWTEPQPADGNRQLSVAALASQSPVTKTTSNGMSSLSGAATAVTGGLKVRVDILKTPLDRLPPPSRGPEAERLV
jgi:hypothetical protein